MKSAVNFESQDSSSSFVRVLSFTPITVMVPCALLMISVLSMSTNNELFLFRESSIKVRNVAGSMTFSNFSVLHCSVAEVRLMSGIFR